MRADFPEALIPSDEGDGRLSDGTRRTDEAAVSKVLHGEVNIAILNLA